MTFDKLDEIVDMVAALKRNFAHRKAILSGSTDICLGAVALVGRTQELARDAVLQALEADYREIKGVLALHGIELG